MTGKVYDVSNFMVDHPGGGELLLEQAGKDATNAFDEVGHSNEALEQMEECYIGEFKKPEKNSKRKKRRSKKK